MYDFTWAHIQEQIDTNIHIIMNAVYQHLNKKLDQLQTRMQDHKYTTNKQHQLYPRIINLSDATFSTEQINTLNLGLDFALEQTPLKNIDKLRVETENAITHLNPSIQNFFRHRAATVINQIAHTSNNNMQHKRHQYILSGIRDKLQENNLTTARADKSKAMAIKAPAYKTARYLNKTINNYITLPNTYSTRNTADVAAELILLHLNEQHRLMTLDIKDLYVNITLPSIMNSTYHWFRNQNQPKTIIDQILQLMQTVLQQNYFHTNGHYYRPNKGIAMGSPLSSTASEIVLQHIEHLLIKHWLETKEILYYKRYVDDILIIYDSAKLNPDQVTDSFNHYNPDLHFTSTHENNNCINYLDLTITRAAHSLQLGIYRKPTNTDTTINYNSTHPIQHKLAAYRYYISRMVTLPISHTEKEKEWNIIQNIASSNSIPPDTPYKLRRQIQQKSHKTSIQTINPNAWVTFTFSSPIIYKVTNLFRKTDLKIA
jgi:hypothetical protein